jgi:hypothetical protein
LIQSERPFVLRAWVAFRLVRGGSSRSGWPFGGCRVAVREALSELISVPRG